MHTSPGRPRPTEKRRPLFPLLAASPLALLSLILPAAAGSGPSAAAAPAGPRVFALKLEPASLTLAHARDARRVLVLGQTAAEQWVDLTLQARFRPAAAVVRVDREGYFHPERPGTTRVVVSAAGQRAVLPLAVTSVANPPVSFVRDVMPILSRTGCNAGTCHGSAKGKNGFKLSLRGYDPEFDYNALVDAVAGRRFNRADPDQSLMLLKATQGVPHQGGLVFERNSPPYRVLRQWIAEGVKLDLKTTRVARLEVRPREPVMTLPGLRQQLLVIAHYPDGATRDVTRDAVYTSSVPDVATVTPAGLVTAVRRGETAMLIRYEGAYATNPLIVLGDRTGYRWVSSTPEYNFIDTLVHRKLQRIQSLPSELCSDADFLRRVSLDLTGLPPAPEETRAFLSDPAPSRVKRERVIDRLLGSTAYVDHWTNKWADLLQCNRKFLGEKGVWAFRNWIQDSVAANVPYDRFVRELLTTSGNTYEHPAASFFRVARAEPALAAEITTQLFLGVRFACAKCHDHPFERWTQTQYYQIAAFFSGVGTKRHPEQGDEFVYDRADGLSVTHPKTGLAVAPAFPVAAQLASLPAAGRRADDPGAVSRERREAIARWLTSPENPFFARAMANRMWSYFMGRGIIDPVDDIRSSNPPSNPELLDALTREFIRGGFDLKHLMRTIVRSRVYQLSVKSNRWNADDTINHSRAYPRRLTAEQLLDAIVVATGHTLKFEGLPAGIRAVQLPDSKVGAGGLLDLFGRPARESPCECERTSNVSLGQALNLINGGTLSEAIVDPKGRIARLMATNPTDAKIVEELYLAALCRPPRPDELKTATGYLKSAESRTEGAQDLLWALINSPAFLFNR